MVERVSRHATEGRVAREGLGGSCVVDGANLALDSPTGYEKLPHEPCGFSVRSSTPSLVEGSEPMRNGFPLGRDHFEFDDIRSPKRLFLANWR